MRLLSTSVVLSLLLTTTASAEWILSAPPREDADEAARLYAPLAAELSKALNDKVVFKAPTGWAAFSQEMKEDKYDFVIDGPHFVAWRMEHTRHVPLVRVDGQLAYTVFAGKDGPARLEDLKFKNVCSMASPNLAAVVLLAQFDSYVAPNVVAPRGGFKGALAAFEEGRCAAVALPNFFIEKLPPEKVAGLKTLFTSTEMPGLALTAGPRVPAAQHTLLVKALTDPAAQTNLKPLLDNLSGKEGGALVPAAATDYAGYQKLLEGVVWGW